MTADELRQVLSDHAEWHRSNGSTGKRADLRSASLRGADLSGAILISANLISASLRDANLSDANLSNAILSNAILRDANLSNAYLRGAILSGADLRGAILPNGKTLPDYITWLPSGLLTQGGKPLADVVAAWDCHEWTGCPMHAAFGATGLGSVPDCWRAEAATFVALFDGRHVPRPEVTA